MINDIISDVFSDVKEEFKNGIGYDGFVEDSKSALNEFIRGTGLLDQAKALLSTGINFIASLAGEWGAWIKETFNGFMNSTADTVGAPKIGALDKTIALLEQTSAADIASGHTIDPDAIAVALKKSVEQSKSGLSRLTSHYLGSDQKSFAENARSNTSRNVKDAAYNSVLEAVLTSPEYSGRTFTAEQKNSMLADLAKDPAIKRYVEAEADTYSAAVYQATLAQIKDPTAAASLNVASHSNDPTDALRNTVRIVAGQDKKNAAFETVKALHKDILSEIDNDQQQFDNLVKAAIDGKLTMAHVNQLNALPENERTLLVAELAKERSAFDTALATPIDKIEFDKEIGAILVTNKGQSRPVAYEGISVKDVDTSPPPTGLPKVSDATDKSLTPAG